MAKQSEIMAKQLELAAKRESELKALQLKLKEQDRQVDRLQIQLQDRDSYISRLATVEEVAKIKQQVRDLDLTVLLSKPQLCYFYWLRWTRPAKSEIRSRHKSKCSRRRCIEPKSTSRKR
jgi:hypothetical protein